MRGFIVAHGRSGTTWVAYALSRCTDLDARHESMRYSVGESFAEKGVEVNGNLYQQIPLIESAHPKAKIVHQVRDGRKVIRSAISNKWGERIIEQACRTWAARNERMANEIPAECRFRLEDLISSFEIFVSLSLQFGTVADRNRWERVRHSPKNETAHRCPKFEAWLDADQTMFWDICGATMERMGYER